MQKGSFTPEYRQPLEASNPHTSHHLIQLEVMHISTKSQEK